MRKALIDSGLTLAEIAVDSGAALTSVRRFVVDGKDVRLSTAVDLAASVGCELRLVPIAAEVAGQRRPRTRK
ncbi:MAG: hypothetical protein U0836_04820 [Pirellulales bacterium]